MRLKRPDISETLAGSALVIKIAQYVAESSGVKMPEVSSFASFLSLVLFGSSIILWLRSSRDKLQKVDTIADRMEQIKEDLDKIDYIARYGPAPVYLARLAWARDHMHGRAGGQTLFHVLVNVYARAAEDLYDMTRGSKDTVEFVEYHLVDKFLLNFMKSLPNGSVWLGVTRLQFSDAWIKGSAEDSYFEFQELVEQRTRARTIEFFRLWCFDDESRLPELEPLLESQQKAGLQVRTIVSNNIPDMSLIWVPTSQRPPMHGALADLDEFFPKLVGEQREYEPLCAIEFKARGGKELDAMTLHAPGADRFTQLRLLYKKSWDKASAVRLV